MQSKQDQSTNSKAPLNAGFFCAQYLVSYTSSMFPHNQHKQSDQPAAGRCCRRYGSYSWLTSLGKKNTR